MTLTQSVTFGLFCSLPKNFNYKILILPQLTECGCRGLSGASATQLVEYKKNQEKEIALNLNMVVGAVLEKHGIFRTVEGSGNAQVSFCC